MSQLLQLRSTADLLFKQSKYNEAYQLYNEIYNQIWASLGFIQNGFLDFTHSFLFHDIKSAIYFRNSFMQPAASTVFLKRFGLDLDGTLNLFSFTLHGRLQCIGYSDSLFNKTNVDTVLSEFLLLYNLILHQADENWFNALLRVMTPLVDNNGLKKLRPNLQEHEVIKRLINAAEKVNMTDWFAVNLSILKYIKKAGKENTLLYSSINQIAGSSSSHSRQRKSKQNEYEQYEKYEKYERYEKYEKYERSYTKNSGEFDLKTATDEEKAKYFGNILGLEGKVFKSQIRQKYIEAIGLYHPDKIQHMGKELVKLAEKRTKEINMAYEWFKEKHGLQ